ncbi:MAG TPA: alpha/beta fold hydrolase [Sphingomonadaceae bacterium]|nr:alpha/beta fold hydrolase [Sphingomonadaceae bacterium]
MSRSDSSPSLDATSFDGCRLHVVRHGAAGRAPVLFINAIGLDHHMWDGQVAALADRHAIIRYDSRGHGRSDVPGGEYSIDMLGRDAVSVIDAAGFDRVSVVGCSIGGMTAMWVAAMAPERVERLVLSNCTAHIGRPAVWDDRIAEIEARGMAAIAEPTVARWLSDTFKATRPDEARRMVEQLRATPADGFAGMCAVLRDADLRALLPRIAAPTLVIGADEAPAARLADAIRNARHRLMPAAGHLSNLESPPAFNAALADFLGPGTDLE